MSTEWSLGPSAGASQATVSRGVPVSQGFNELTWQERRELLFGPPNTPHNSNEDSGPVSNRTLPFAWRGQNTRVNQVMIRKITRTDDFMCRTILPIHTLPAGNSFQISTIQFNDTLLDNIPEQGTARLTSQSMRSWSFSVARQGLAFMMEDGLAMSDIGVEQYNASILQISNATVDTLCLDGYYNLLTCPAAGGMTVYQQYGITEKNPTRQHIFEQEVRLWSILSKTEFGFWMMSDIGKRIFAARRVNPDTLILPANSQNYLARNRQETIRYQEFGPRGVDAFLGKGYIQYLVGFDIYESQLYHTTNANVPEDPLVRMRSIGEFGDSIHTDNAVGVEELKYKTTLRNRVIHDNRDDLMATLTCDEMWRNCGLFHSAAQGGLLTKEFGRPFFAGYAKLGAYLRSRTGLSGPLFDVVKNHLVARMAASQGQMGVGLLSAWRALRATLVTAAAAGEARDPGYMPATGGNRASAAAATNELGMPVSGGNRGRGSDSGDDAADEDMMTIYVVSQVEEAALKKKRVKKADQLAKEGGALSFPVDETGKTIDLSSAWRQFNHDHQFNAASLSVLGDALEKEQQTSGRAALDSSHMVWLRIYFADPAKQRRLYSVKDKVFAEMFLRLLYGGYSDPSRVYAARPQPMRYAANTAETGSRFYDLARSGMDLAPTVGLEDRDIRPAPRTSDEKREFLALYKSYEASYQMINAYIPNFVTGVFSLLVSKGCALATAKTAIEDGFGPLSVLIASWKNDKSQRPADTENERRLTGSAGDAAKATLNQKADAIIDYLNSHRSVKNLEEVFAWYNQLVDGELAINDFVAKFLNRTGDATLTNGSISSWEATDESVADALTDIPITRHFFDFCVKNDIPLPIDFVFARPAMTYECGSAIMLLRGLTTGATFMGESDFQLSNEGARKVLFGFFTLYAGARVMNHMNVFVMPNVTCHRYVGGGGMKCFDNGNLQQREDYFQQGRTNENSIFIIPMHHGETIAGGVFDLTGSFPGEYAGNRSPTPHYSMAAAMRRLWNWMQPADAYSHDFFGQSIRTYNTVCFRMTMYLPKVSVGGGIAATGYIKEGCGHWGKHVYAGVRNDRCGISGSGFVDKALYNVHRADPVNV